MVRWAQPAAVVVGDEAQHLELLRCHVAVRELHPHHLVVTALALAVDAVVEPEHPEGVLVDPAGQMVGEQSLELLDVGRELRRERRVDGAGLHASSQPKLTVVINF